MRIEAEESLCWVPLEAEHIGYINNTDEVVIDGGFIHAEDFKNGLAAVRTRVHYGYINQKGEWIYQIAIDDLYRDRLLSAIGF